MELSSHIKSLNSNMLNKTSRYLLTFLSILGFSSFYSGQKNSASEITSPDFKSRNIYINVVDYFGGAISLGYEYIGKNGDFSFRMPFAIGINTLKQENLSIETYNRLWARQAYYRENKQWGTGLECYFYPRRYGNFRYYLGPSIELGWFKYQQRFSLYVPNGLFDLRFIIDNLGSYQSVLLQQGFVFQPSPRINFNMGLGLGFCRARFRQQGNNGNLLNDNVRDEVALRYMLTVGYKLF